LIPQETLSNNFADGDINDVIDNDLGIFTDDFVFVQYPHSRWRDTERMTCDFGLGLPIPKLAGRKCFIFNKRNPQGKGNLLLACFIGKEG
jgi:hypothetical protein